MDTFKWPQGYNSAATFSFDVDASAEEMLHHGTVSGAYSAGNYGPRAGLPRILDLLDGLGVKATFHVPGWVAEVFPREIKEAHQRGHEIAAHGYLHENISLLDSDTEREIHRKSHGILGDLTGTPPRGFRTPGGPLTPRTIEMLLELGYDYDSSSCSDYFPSLLTVGEHRVRMAELPWSWLLDDFPFFWGGVDSGNFAPISLPDDALEYWIAEFDSIHEIGGLCVLVNHPRCIGRPSRIRILKEFINHVKDTPGVWLTTQERVADWVLGKHETGDKPLGSPGSRQ
ncbi:MAG: polysaccharide deacetylase [Deltaproteobacteria bacterium]|nr:polysaccharide deacetylase [Deltaproteobacteria bacterium]MBW2122862.1 polysaccharide deacetylase [Deltaproteobacteria bacterium]